MDVYRQANPFGNAHGGAIFALADHAFGNCCKPGVFTEVADLQASLYRTGSETLEAVAEKISENELNSLYRVIVYEGSRIIATFEGVGIKMVRKEP